MRYIVTAILLLIPVSALAVLITAEHIERRKRVKAIVDAIRARGPIQ